MGRPTVGRRLALSAAALPLLVAAPALAAGPRPDQPPQQQQQPTGGNDLVARGQQLYQVGCVSCHGVDGRGVEQRGPTLEAAGPASTDFYLSSGRMPAASGAGQPGRKEPVYDAGQRAALVAYVSTLGQGPPIPDVDPARGDLPLGQQLYTANCAACHNSAGSGGALGQAIYAPALYPATQLQVGEAVRVGPGAMPAFNEEQLDQQQLDSVVLFVTHLQDPVDRGGLPLGRVGPVPEGLVAWLVGLGLIVLAIRWIGTRDAVSLTPEGEAEPEDRGDGANPEPSEPSSADPERAGSAAGRPPAGGAGGTGGDEQGSSP